MEVINYHRNILEGNKDASHPYLEEALKFISDFEMAIDNVINSGNWYEYSQSVQPYDKFLWEKYYNEAQKTNPINTSQNKIFSSFRELLLFPLWFRIKKELPFETEVILNKPIVQTIYNDYTIVSKDVDGGLYVSCEIKGEKMFCPVIVNEDKGGHFCSTTSSNVNSIHRKFKDTNRNIFTVATTDNNITIGKDKDCDYLGYTDLVFSIRGKNGEVKKKYSPLSHERFQRVEKVFIEKLALKSIEDFKFDKMNIRNKSNRKIREVIDNEGLLFNF